MLQALNKLVLELQRLIDDHYQAESQTLTTGAEANLLKLAELRERGTEAQRARWEAIKSEFVRVKRMGGKADDPVARVTGTLSGLDAQLQGIREAIGIAAKELQKGGKKQQGGAFDAPSSVGTLVPLLERIEENLKAMAKPQQVVVDVKQEPPPGMGELIAQQVSLIQNTLVPLVNAALARGAGSQAGPQLQALEARIAELAQVSRMLGEKLESGALAGAPRFELALTLTSKSNFFLPAGGGTIEQNGGLFVATYAKAPKAGVKVAIDMTFPTGAECRLIGLVVWIWEASLSADPTRPVGFAVRLAPLEPAARALVGAYVSERPPMLVEGV